MTTIQTPSSFAKSVFFLILLLSFGAIGKTQTSSIDSPGHPVVGEILRHLPDSYTSGVEGAKYGVYETVLRSDAKKTQEYLTLLEKKVLGLGVAFQGLAPSKQGEVIYYLEAELLRLYQHFVLKPSENVSGFEQAALRYQTVRIYGQLRQQGERLYYDMLRTIDKAFPGPNGLQLREEVGKDSYYSPNFRKDVALSESDAKVEYARQEKEFIDKGGSLSEIFTLDETSIRTMQAFSRVEYVQLANREVRVTYGQAGHVLLAKGEKTMSAGQLIFIKDLAGKIALLIVSNSSGNFKPDLYSAEMLAQELGKRFDVSPDKIVVTAGEPLSTQATKLYLKVEGLEAGTIKETTQKIEDLGRAITSIQSFRCKAAIEDIAK